MARITGSLRAHLAELEWIPQIKHASPPGTEVKSTSIESMFGVKYYFIITIPDSPSFMVQIEEIEEYLRSPGEWALKKMASRNWWRPW